MALISSLPNFPDLPRPSLPGTDRIKPLLKTAFRKVDKVVPFKLKKRLIEETLNRAFVVALEDGEFDYLEGRALGLEVTDLKLKLAFTCIDEQLIVQPGYGCDAWIKGESGEFLKLANRSEDPDTLFFQRKLLIEGDTELGLGTKNLLDSIDWEELPALFQHSQAVLQRFS
ncbi:ubiquinone anaerobic biosynthesis accessory factor UbiT [Amphritea sp. HPY]|uniref:ubiquinone anaerobic biosynthesis accessory factor UbiT n=1 Tax=Amphritea sp. HPY TaxID=3421652 RepID=UPI003D7D375A